MGTANTEPLSNNRPDLYKFHFRWRWPKFRRWFLQDDDRLIKVRWASLLRPTFVKGMGLEWISMLIDSRGGAERTSATLVWNWPRLRAPFGD